MAEENSVSQNLVEAEASFLKDTQENENSKMEIPVLQEISLNLDETLAAAFHRASNM